MKKFLLLFSLGLGVCLISCKNEGGMSEAAKKNLDAHHGISKSFETKDFSKIGDYIAEDCVDHSGDNGDVKGLTAIKAQFEKWVSMTENDKAEPVREMADDEYVMAWMKFSGKRKVDGMGQKAGDSYNMQSVEVSKFKDGKVIEHWTFVDPAEMMKMMQSMGQPPAMPATDSSKHDMKDMADSTKKM